MSLRDVLVHIDHTPHGMQRVRLAIDLASRHRSSLTVLHVQEREAASTAALRAAELGLMPAKAQHDLECQIDVRLESEAQELGAVSLAAASQLAVKCDFVSIVGETGIIVSQHARFFDISVVGHGGGPVIDLPYGYRFAEAMLFMTGRPLIMVPPSVATTTLGRRVALAWNGSRPAARALSDALPLIERADATSVLTANSVDLPQAASLPDDALLTHLRRHSDGIEIKLFEHLGDDIGDALQEEAIAAGADLLVAGAYGHPKLWERLLGGVTRDLLAGMRLPLLLAH